MNTYVAVNLTAKEILLNNKKFPIIFYLNEKDTVISFIKNDDSFRQFIASKVYNYNLYAFSEISLIYLNESENYAQDTFYVQETFSVQDIFKFQDMSEIESNFYLDYVKYHFNYLYKCAYKIDYNFSDNPLDIYNDIINIYKQIKQKHPEKIIKSTVLNYIRSELIKTDNLSDDNTDWIYTKLENIIKD